MTTASPPAYWQRQKIRKLWADTPSGRIAKMMNIGYTTLRCWEIAGHLDPLPERTIGACPHCGGEFAPNALAHHIPACLKKPERDELAELCEAGHSQEALARYYQVGRDTLRMWLVEYGLKTQARPGAGTPELPSKEKRSEDRLVRDRKLAPHHGNVYGCPCDNDCANECNRLSAGGWWVLCEWPTEHHVRLAVEAGLLTATETKAADVFSGGEIGQT